MNRPPSKHLLSNWLSLLVAGFLYMASMSLAAASSVDEDKALATLKDNGCTKCHSLSKRKKGPSYHEVARKYAGKPNAHDTVYKHLTGSPVIKLEEGDEEHSAPKITDRNEMDNLIRFILQGKQD